MTEMATSQAYPVKSNAARAAKRYGLGRDALQWAGGGWVFEIPSAKPAPATVEPAVPAGWDKIEGGPELVEPAPLALPAEVSGMIPVMVVEPAQITMPVVAEIDAKAAAAKAVRDAKRAARAATFAAVKAGKKAAREERAALAYARVLRRRCEIRAAGDKAAAKAAKPTKPVKTAKKSRGPRTGICADVIAAIHARWTSIDDLMKLSGWQRHTLRGYISTRAGVDGFTVERRKVDGVSQYRVKPEPEAA